MEMLEALLAVAIEAGVEIQRIRAAGFAVQRKADESPVTAADQAAERLILAHLARLSPGIPVIAEEAVAAGALPQAGPRFFLVDPLDGTREFVAGRDEFTVNVALVDAGVPVLGVVVAPALGRAFAGDAVAGRAWECGTQGAGARRALRARIAPADGGVAVASRSHGDPQTEAWLVEAGLSRRVSIGSSLKFCLLAAGEADVYPRFGPTMEWDTAAGDAVLRAASGSVHTLDGLPLRYGKAGFRNPPFIARGAAPG